MPSLKFFALLSAVLLIGHRVEAVNDNVEVYNDLNTSNQSLDSFQIHSEFSLPQGFQQQYFPQQSFDKENIGYGNNPMIVFNVDERQKNQKDFTREQNKKYEIKKNLYNNQNKGKRIKINVENNDIPSQVLQRLSPKKDFQSEYEKLILEIFEKQSISDDKDHKAFKEIPINILENMMSQASMFVEVRKCAQNSERLQELLKKSEKNDIDLELILFIQRMQKYLNNANNYKNLQTGPHQENCFPSKKRCVCVFPPL